LFTNSFHPLLPHHPPDLTQAIASPPSTPPWQPHAGSPVIRRTPAAGRHRRGSSSRPPSAPAWPPRPRSRGGGTQVSPPLEGPRDFAGGCFDPVTRTRIVPRICFPSFPSFLDWVKTRGRACSGGAPLVTALPLPVMLPHLPSLWCPALRSTSPVHPFAYVR